VEQPLYFFLREDVGNKLWWFGNDPGKRRTGRVSPRHRKTIEAMEPFMFAVPEARNRTSTGDEGLHPINRNLSYKNVSHGSTKRLQGTGFSVETHAHRLFMRNVL